jgi:hypothetical protein
LEGPPLTLRRQMMDESVRLLTLQQQLEQDAKGAVAFAGLSVDGTIHACLLNNMSKKADKIKADFKVPDKRCAAAPLPPSHTSLTPVAGSGTRSCTR